MSKTRRHKKYRPRDPMAVKLRAMPWELVSVLAPFREFLDELRDEGTISIVDGRPHFIDRFYSEVYPLMPAANGFIGALEKDSAGFGDPVDIRRTAAVRAVFSCPIQVSNERGLWETFGSAGFRMRRFANLQVLAHPFGDGVQVQQFAYGDCYV